MGSKGDWINPDFKLHEEITGKDHVRMDDHCKKYERPTNTTRNNDLNEVIEIQCYCVCILSPLHYHSPHIVDLLHPLVLDAGLLPPERQRGVAHPDPLPLPLETVHAVAENDKAVIF